MEQGAELAAHNERLLTLEREMKDMRTAYGSLAAVPVMLANLDGKVDSLRRELKDHMASEETERQADRNRGLTKVQIGLAVGSMCITTGSVAVAIIALVTRG